MVKTSMVSKGLLAMVAAFGLACSEAAPDVAVTAQPLTTVDVDRVLGFEAPTVSDWSIIQSGPGTLATSTTASQGTRSLAVSSHGYGPVQSVALSSLGTRVGSTIRYDIMLPSDLKQVSPAYFGATQLYVSIPSQGLNNAYLGQVDLTPLPLGQWNTATFTPTAAVLTKLRGTYADLRVTIVVNAPSMETKPYLIDNLRFSDKTLALVTVVDGSAHPLAGLTVVAYSGSSTTGSTGVTDSTGLAKVWVPTGSYRFGVTDAAVTTYSSPTNQCQVPGICPAATIALKCHSVVCAAKDNCHPAGTCNPTSGVCSNQSLPNCTACGGGQVDCDGNPANGCETNENSDVLNCGGCGIRCFVNNGTPACVTGKCVEKTCNAGFADCNGLPIDGCEINISSDVNNCGGCGTVCSANNGTPACAAGQCTEKTCNAGFADCNRLPIDGCEINISSDIKNCGGCGITCSANNGTPACVAGQCPEKTCNPGFADCNANPADGCETNVTTDLNNCSACGTKCIGANGAEACMNGQCKVTTCDPGFADCNGNPADGCEADTLFDGANCGGCGQICAPPRACQYGSCRNNF